MVLRSLPSRPGQQKTDTSGSETTSSAAGAPYLGIDDPLLPASLDTLTGLPNRQAFLFRVRSTLAHASRRGGVLSLMVLGIDRFHHINDEFGYEAGDQVLTHIGQAIQQQVRRKDLTGRIGNKRFACLVLEPDAHTAWQAAEKLRQQIARQSIPLPSGHASLNASVSIGMSFQGQDGNSLEPLLRIAEERLYCARMLGHNCVVWQGQPDNISISLEAPSSAVPTAPENN